MSPRKSGLIGARVNPRRTDAISPLQSPVVENNTGVIVAIYDSPRKMIPSREEASRTEILRSDPQQAFDSSLDARRMDDLKPKREPSSDKDFKTKGPRSYPSDSQEAFHSSVEAQDEYHEAMRRRRKRKRRGDFPSSSPSEREAPSKRRHPKEIPSTPNLSPKRSPSPWAKDEFPSAEIPFTDMPIEDERNGDWEPDDSSEDESTQEDDRPLGGEASPVLSDHYPMHGTQGTQGILEAPTQVVDLEVASPEGGWETADEGHREPSEDPSTPAAGKVNLEWDTQMQSTEAVFDDRTQVLDLSPPEPDVGASEDALPQAEVNARLDAWIDGHIAAGRSAADAILALECTSLDHHLADQVLEHMSRHEGRIPPDVRGVWTEMDDVDLGSTDANVVRGLLAKHGMESLDLREQYLVAYRTST